MRIVIMTSGSRGDVQPYIALGLGLRRAGYQVCMLTHSIFAQMIEQYGLEFAPLTGNPRAMLETQKGQHFIESGGNALRFIREMMEMGKGQQEAFMKDAWRTLPGADLLLYTSLCFVGSYVAEALHIPAIFAPTPTHYSLPGSSPIIPCVCVLPTLEYVSGPRTAWATRSRSYRMC